MTMAVPAGDIVGNPHDIGAERIAQYYAPVRILLNRPSLSQNLARCQAASMLLDNHILRHENLLAFEEGQVRLQIVSALDPLSLSQ